MRTDTMASRLARVAGRLRERALASGTFDAELALDLETLADVAATLQTMTRRVDAICAELEAVHDVWTIGDETDLVSGSRLP